jgi:hypothetical protein
MTVALTARRRLARTQTRAPDHPYHAITLPAPALAQPARVAPAIVLAPFEDDPMPEPLMRKVDEIGHAITSFGTGIGGRP